MYASVPVSETAACVAPVKLDARLTPTIAGTSAPVNVRLAGSKGTANIVPPTAYNR
jgi:hypothetical protein